jgi:hypothetical protein
MKHCLSLRFLMPSKELISAHGLGAYFATTSKEFRQFSDHGRKQSGQNTKTTAIEAQTCGWRVQLMRLVISFIWKRNVFLW